MQHTLLYLMAIIFAVELRLSDLGHLLLKFLKIIFVCQKQDNVMVTESG